MKCKLVAALAIATLVGFTHEAKVTVPVDAKAVYGLQCDGSDESVKMRAAFAASLNEEVAFPAGTCAGSDLLVFPQPPIMRTAGMARTTFKNLSATSPMFVFQREGGQPTSFASFGGFTLDQNGSTGNGIKITSQFGNLHDIAVRGQAGDGRAFWFESPTLGDMNNIHVYQSSNCFKVKTTYYLSGNNWSCERTTGIGLDIETSVMFNVKGLYVDNGPAVIPGNAGELIRISSSYSIGIDGLGSEIDSASLLGTEAFINVANSVNVNFHGVNRIKHAPQQNQSKCIFMADNSTVTLTGFEWVETTSATIFACAKNQGARLALKDIVTQVNNGGASAYLVGAWYRPEDGNASSAPVNRVSLENITHLGQQVPAYISASSVYCRQIGNTQMVTGTGGPLSC